MGPRTTEMPTSNFTESKKGPQSPTLQLWELGNKMEAAEGDSSDKMDILQTETVG